MELIDTHCHLDMKPYDNDRKDVIQRAQERGVTHMITIGIDVETSRKAISIAHQYHNIYASVGIHPHDANSCTSDSVSELAKMAKDPKVIAIGETGLDFYRDYSPPSVQEKGFKMQLELAKQCNLPIIIHDREAHQKVLHILEEVGVPACGGVFHCFSGNIALADMVLKMGFYISIPGTITFKNVKELDEVIKKVPSNRLLIETDAPFLTPVPYRGKRNEPAYLVYTLKAIAAKRGIHEEEMARITTENARKIFKLP